MNDCRVVVTRLGRFLDGELSPQETTDMEAHLRGCPGCRQELRAFQMLSASLDALTVPPVPAGMTENIIIRIRHGIGVQNDSGFLGFWRTWPIAMRFAAVGTVAAACLIGFTLGTAALGTRRTPTSGEMGWVAVESGATLVSAYVGALR